MKNISVVNYIKDNLAGRALSILELGSGDNNEAMQIRAGVTGEYFAIDKKEPVVPASTNITFVNANLFDIKEVEKIICDKKFDFIFANYSLCFNKKDTILENLPYYFNKLEEGGIFYVGDFTANEEVVQKRTNLDDEWFFDFIKSNFKSFEISRQEVYEEVHGHTHRIFELIAHK